tara:strand:+ start:893 stop:2083 length:1191 start_codon:yes stop_codon:yes gene_type:complete
MANDSIFFFIDINDSNFTFAAIQKNEENFTLTYNNKVPIEGFKNNLISDFDLVKKTIKDNIYNAEQKLGVILKEVILIINNYDCSIINLTGFQKLNGSQLTKENITYILNSLKSKIEETESEKTVIHIFNSKFSLDTKDVENIPIGLFGNFYSHELSFFLIKNLYHKNLQNIFSECNLKINRIISKNYIDGINLIKDDFSSGTFLNLEINQESSHIFYFENSALKFSQDFNFGYELIIKDICKIISFKSETVKKILINFDFLNLSKEELIKKEFFEEKNFRKIEKRLIYQIAEARIQEKIELIILKNLNLSSFLKKDLRIFLKINDFLISKSFKKIYQSYLSNKGNFDVKIIENFDEEKFFLNAYSLVQYGWKKEAVPVVLEKKSIITRFFNLFFK